MRIGIVTDASCDLPGSFLQAHGIGILPVHIVLGDTQIEDRRDERATARFYAERQGAALQAAQTRAPDVDALRGFFLERVLPFCDYALCVTISATRSSLYDSAAKAAFALLAAQQSAGDAVQSPFAMRVIDSKSMFSGTGLLVAEGARLAAAGATPLDLRQRLEDLRERVCAYMVPDDLYYLRARAQAKGEKTVDWLSYAVGTALDLRPVILGHRGETQVLAQVRGRRRALERLFAHIARQIEHGLDTEEICVSYGGALEVLHALPGYAELRAVAARHCVTLLESMMSMTAAVNVGAGCLAIAYAGERRAFSG